MDIRSWKVEGNQGAQRNGKREAEDSPDGSTRPKSRIRRSMTACNTCRKLKTRCDLEPRSHACRRCLSLRIECELPEASERVWEHATNWPNAAGLLPSSIEDRLSSLEQSMRDLTSMVRQIMETLSNRSRSPVARSRLPAGNVEFKDSVSEDNYHASPSVAPKPVHLITELQSEFFGEKEDFVSEAYQLGDIVTQGLIDFHHAVRLIQLFVDHFGPWISIYSVSDLPPNLRQNDPFFFSTACLLASRYVPAISLPVIHKMYRQVRRLSASVLWSAPPLKYASLQALSLLCLWSATVQTEVPMDSWLLSGIAINHAIIAFDFLGHLAEPVVTNDVLKQLRVWNALCLTQLHFAIGNARPFNVKQKYLDYCSQILESPAARFEDGRVVAEIQLYSLTLGLQSHHQRIQHGETEYEELARWKQNWAHLLMDERQSVLLRLSFWFCQLLLYRTSLRSQSDSDRLISEVVKSARLILSTFLQVPPDTAVDFIDHVFFIAAYAALTLCEFDISNPLVDQIQIQLIHISPNEEHIAYRFACLIGELKRRSAEMVHPPPTAVKSSPQHFMNTRRANAAEASVIPSSLMNPIPEGYGSLEQLLTGFMPAPVDSVPTPTYLPSNGMATPNVTHQFPSSTPD